MFLFEKHFSVLHYFSYCTHVTLYPWLTSDSILLTN